MKLDEPLLRSWIRTARPGHPDPDALYARLLERVREPAFCDRHRVRTDAMGVRTAMQWWPREPGYVTLDVPQCRPGLHFDEEDDALLAETLEAAWRHDAARVGLRIRHEQATPDLLRLVVASGAEEQDGRVEYRSPLSELPTHGPGPLRWRTVDDPPTLAAMLVAASEHASDGLDEHEDPQQVARHLLEVDDGSKATAFIGRHEGKDVAVVRPLMEGGGWSTLSFMGVIARARGQGLGHAVQRFGIEVLRGWGAREYHGGTSAGNHAMRACFRRQGVAPYAQFRCFEWPAPASAADRCSD